MSEIRPRADDPPLNWSDLGMSELLPTGTVTLLLADVEGSTRLWETQPDEMTAAVALLERTVAETIAAHGGVRPVEQGEGDSFVAAFARAGDAVAGALALQRAPLAPIRLRIGVHTGDVQLRDEGNYIGPTINRTARLRDLAHGGQTVLSGTTSDVVADMLPADAWLTDLGTHQLRDLPRPERVLQLCHPDLGNEFPPLRATNAVAAHNLPVPLTSFVGRGAQIADVRRILVDNRLVTLTGAGGAGKTRLAVQVAGDMTAQFGGGVWYVDLAPITDPDVVSVTMARALGLPDQVGRSTIQTLIRFIGERRMLVVLDNCEHLLDASAELVVSLLGVCPALTLLTTSREPIGVDGEVSWRVPSLSLADEAVELFTDRARRVRPDFGLTDQNAAAVTEICQRLDGLPLAIELAAARVRALSLTEILDSLHDRFRLLTGGARTAVRRQQTLHASVDWSHALLTEPERMLFRRLAVFLGGFDLDAAQAVAGAGEVERHQVLDLLTLLIDKSLVVAENASGPSRYRLLETVRQYAQEKLGESGEADAVRNRHREHYTALAAAPVGYEQRIARAEANIDNLRAAFTWSRETDDITTALRLVSALYPLWSTRGRIQEGLAWFDAVLTDDNVHNREVPPAVRARALADKTLLDAVVAATDNTAEAELGVSLAREAGDRVLLVRTLTACGRIAIFHPEVARPYFAEAIELARTMGNRRRLSDILAFQAYGACVAGDPVAARDAAEEGRDLADEIGDRALSRLCRLWLATAHMMLGKVTLACTEFDDLLAEADAANDPIYMALCLINQCRALTYGGAGGSAQAAANGALAASREFVVSFLDTAYGVLVGAALAAGDVAAAADASEAARQHTTPPREPVLMAVAPMAEAALARGDLTAAKWWADKAISVTTGWCLSTALTARARVAIAQGEPEQAERDAHEALARAAEVEAYLGIPDTLECLAGLAGDASSHPEAARLFGAAEAFRQRMGVVRFKIHDAGYEASVAALRDAMGEQDFDTAWKEGAALSIEEAIAYAQRGRGERKRPTSGWSSLTPAEREVVRLVSEGLANKDIATRLFVSPRTVQTHLTHVYTKLGLTSRVQLVQEAARRT